MKTISAPVANDVTYVNPVQIQWNWGHVDVTGHTVAHDDDDGDNNNSYQFAQVDPHHICQPTVCVQLCMLADNLTLLASAVVSLAVQQSIDISCPPGRRQQTTEEECSGRITEQTDGRTLGSFKDPAVHTMQ